MPTDVPLCTNRLVTRAIIEQRRDATHQMREPTNKSLDAVFHGKLFHLVAQKERGIMRACNFVRLCEEQLMGKNCHAVSKPRKMCIVLTKKIPPLKVSPASITRVFSRRMIQQMPLQMLGSSERPPTPVIRADKLLPFILAQVPSLTPAGP